MDLNTHFETGIGIIVNRPAFSCDVVKIVLPVLAWAELTKWIRGGKHLSLSVHIDGRQVMGIELAEIIEENGIVYCLAEDGCYYPDLRLPERTLYNIGKYGLMRWEYLLTNRRSEYLRLLLDGKLNEHLHEVDEECHVRVELLVEQMKAEAGITEELKSADQVKWVGLMNNVRITAEEIVQREMIYV